MRTLITLAFCALFSLSSFGQFKEEVKSFTKSAPGDISTLRYQAPTASKRANHHPPVQSVDLSKIKFDVSNIPVSSKKIVVLAENVWGTPTWVKGNPKSLKLTQRNMTDELAESYLASFDELFQLDVDRKNWEIKTTTTDKEQQHIKLQQEHAGIPVFGGEVWIHMKNQEIVGFNGYVYPIQEKVRRNTLSENEIEQKIKEQYGDKWLVERRQLPYNLDPIQTKLYWYPQDKTKTISLAYEAIVYPDGVHREVIWYDATSGDIINRYSNICQLDHDLHHKHSASCNHAVDGSISTSARDLFNIQRNINVYESGSTRFLLDITRNQMFDAARSSLPNDPVGVIWTLTANGTSPFDNSLSVSQNAASNNNWIGKEDAISAHYNASKAFEYFLGTHNFLSVNGTGGNIVSIVDVRGENNQQMDNAFWNGKAMFYGNGRSAFAFPLARGLDVAGHELSHGVIENTAGLIYQNESGAINESFADIFGAMIDRDDWQIGEDVVNTNAYTSGTMRDMANPNNGGNNLNDLGWQPKHMNERYTGSQDNGGVHINSGIPNRAYYLFASAIGKTKAEKIYFNALKNYLTRTAGFSDLRMAVMNSAVDLYGTSERDAANDAFAQVGIGSGSTNTGGGGITEPNDLAINPGNQVIMMMQNSTKDVVLIEPNGTVLTNSLTDQTPISRPSVTDDGSRILFVNQDQNIYIIEIDWSQNQVTRAEPITSGGGWRNVAVSKDGSKLALTTSAKDNKVTIFDAASQTQKEFTLTNPTTAGGVNTGEVQFSDALEWDYSGQYVLYDANNIISSSSQDIEFWDVGIINVWKNQTDDYTDGHINKIFTGLNEGQSIGNARFSKTNTGIFAFDFVQAGLQNTFRVYATNFETNTLSLVFENAIPGVPEYSVDDKIILFEAETNQGTPVIAQIGIANDRISPSGDASIYQENHFWPIWFATGQRNLHVSTSDVENNINFKAFPNPASDYVDFSWSEEYFSPKQIRISTNHGKIISNLSFDQNQNGQFSWNTTSINNGIYFVQFIDEKTTITKQIIIAK